MVYWYVLLAIQIALFVLAELLRPKPELENAKPASLGDFQFPTATEDRYIPIAWGTVRQKGPNVVWYGDLRQVPITEKVKTGLFSSERIIKGFKYYLGMQLVLCRGEVDALLAVTVGDVDVYSAYGAENFEISAAGSDYRNNDVVTLVGGTFERPARFRLKVRYDAYIGSMHTGAHVVVGLKVLDHGRYSVFPSSPAATAGGSGSGLTISFDERTEITHGEDLEIDCPELFGGDELGSGGVSGILTFYAGTDTQTAPTYLQGNGLRLGLTIASGGSGYIVGDVLEINGGTVATYGNKALAVVTQTSSGVVTSAVVIDPGLYSALPATPATTTGGSGTGCQFGLEFEDGFQSIDGVTPRQLRNCYLIPAAEPIYLGNSTSIKPWAFEIRRIPDPLGLGAEATVNGADANPMNVIYEVLTNREYGLSFETSSIDTTSFETAANTLWSEGNGFSMLLDRPMQAYALLNLIQEQIDGVVFFDMTVGKWKVSLARGGYDVNTLPLLSSSNVIEVVDYGRAAWEDTTNQVFAKFTDRADGWKETSALAYDQANIETLQGAVVPTEVNLPGVKDRDLANSIAWRELRGLSYPLAKATVIVDRTLYGTQPADVLAWTYSVGGESFTRMAMRVGEIDYGELENGRIRMTLIQDVFEAADGVFSPPPLSMGEGNVDALEAFSFQLVEEAPRAIVSRDPATSGAIQDRLFCSARRAANEVAYRILYRHAVGTPSGDYADSGEVYGFMLVGRLQSALARGSAVPLTSLVLVTGPDSQAAIESAFTDSTDPSDLGTNLTNLVSIGGSEYALVTSAQTTGANVQLNGVYRGVLDSVQGAWPAGTPVYLLFVGAGLSEDTVPAGDNVDVKLLPFSASDELEESQATTVALTMSNRVRRPYPPSRISLDGTAWASSTSLEGTGSVPEDYAIDVSNIRRRDLRTGDEVEAITDDAAALVPDYPSANGTTHYAEVRDDPDGANTLLFTVAEFGGTSTTARRIEILKATDGVIPTRMRLDVYARHDYDLVEYDSRVPLRHDFDVTTGLTGQFEMGALDAAEWSNVYTADAAGTHSFTLSSAFTAGNVTYRVNAGTELTLIVAGLTTGMIAGVSVSDTIEIRHASTDTAALKQLDMAAPGAGTDAFAILYT